MDNKLSFEASAFRDWTVLYCQLAYQMWVPEFKRQFDWSISDICYEWNGKYTVMYRTPEEHLKGLFSFVEGEMQKNSQFLLQVADGVVQEVALQRDFFETVNIDLLRKCSWAELEQYFADFTSVMLQPMPKFFIAMYFPQAIEMFYPHKNSEYENSLQQLMEARSKTDTVSGPLGNAFTETFAQVVLERVGIDVALARFLSLEELQSILHSEGHLTLEQKSNLEKSLSARAAYSLVAGGKIVEMEISEYLTNNNWQLAEVKEEALKGVVAYKGEIATVRGTVCVVLNKKELSKVKEGDILVAPMTTPEYGPVFSKIKAIVTDEGGITCHAAIVAREQKIPTLIGTKQGSKVLKDGDEIELNMATGEIRKV